MSSKAELEAAWQAHDDNPNKDKACMKEPGWNNLLAANGGHSRFNPGCVSWVMKYAKAHPIARIIAEAPPPPPREKCEGCKREMNPKHLYEEPMKGAKVCSRRCERRVAQRIEDEIRQKELEVAQKKKHEEFTKCLATGEIPGKTPS